MNDFFGCWVRNNLLSICIFSVHGV